VPQLATVALICPDGGSAEGSCECGGTTLFCAIGDQSFSYENFPGCTDKTDCSCQGTTLVCDDGTKKENFDGCGRPGGPGVCYAPCDPQDPNSCGQGLKCSQYGSATAAGLYACLGDQCKPTEVPPGDGSCWQVCNPQSPNCAEGLKCVLWGSGTSPYYVCFNENVCIPGQTSTEQPGGTTTCDCKGTDYICTDAAGNVVSARYNTSQCGGGDGCECRGPDLYCPDGSVGAFNPQCTGGGDQPNCTCRSTELVCDGKIVDKCSSKCGCTPAGVP
jgi:hypothetical protein